MSRRFARFRPGAPPFAPGYFGIPSDGFCLNVFLVLRDPNDAGRVLVGRPSMDPRWEDVGALDRPRLERLGDRWMLPSSQLVLLESPADAVRRVGVEQLGIELGSVPDPQIFSETYRLRESVETDLHWDLHFIFATAGPRTPPSSPLWRALEYVGVAGTPRAAFGRGHGDILELIGLAPGD